MPSIHHPPEPPRRASVRPRASASDETSSSPRRTRSIVRVFRVLSPREVHGNSRSNRIHRIRAAEIAQSIAIHHPSSISFERRDSPDERTNEKNLSTTIDRVYYIAITYRRRETPRPRPPRRCQTPRARTRGTGLDDRWGSPPGEPRGSRRRGRGAPVRWRSKGCFRRTIAASRSRSRLRRTYR